MMTSDAHGGAVATLEAEGGAAAIYVYAIARRKGGDRLPPHAIEGIVPGAAVYALARGELQAIVSAVPLADFQPDALRAHLEDHAWLRARALAHQRVLAALLEDYAVLPLQFCTLYNSESRVLDMLDASGGGLRAGLDRLMGATEWGVKIFCNREQLVAWAAASSGELQPMRETIGRMSAGAGYMLRKKIALAAQQLAESLERSHAQASHLRLSGVARAAASHPAQAPDVHGQPGAMVLNGSYLVDDREQPRFEAELAQLAEQLAPLGFRCELTGPWPPYSFAAIEGDAS